MRQMVGLLAVALLLALPAAPASADTNFLGVSLRVPGTERGETLAPSDPGFDALAELLGVTREGPAGPTGRGPTNRDAEGPGITLTWRTQYADPWRVDRIFVFGKDDIWVSTRFAVDATSAWNNPERWHRPASPRALFDLLDRLGVARAATGFPSFPEQGEVTAGQPASTPQAAPPEPAASSREPVWSALAAAILGMLVLGAGFFRRLRDRRSGSGSDASPRPEQTGPEADELVWPRR